MAGFRECRSGGVSLEECGGRAGQLCGGDGECTERVAREKRAAEDFLCEVCARVCSRGRACA